MARTLKKRYTRYEKTKMKRILSKKFDKEYKRKRNEQQRRRRQEQKVPLLPPSTTSPAISLKTVLRRKEGQKRRRQHLSELNNEIKDLRQSVRQLTIENRKLKRSRNVTPPRSSATTVLLTNISPSAKKRAVSRLKARREDLDRGSALDLRKTFGINLSNQNLPKKTVPSLLETQIEQFMNRDDISKPCPDKKKHINNQQIRFRLNHLTVLHQQFELETKIDIDYQTFRRHVPEYIQKPDHDSWGTCLCVSCLNPQMKFEKLLSFKQRNLNVKSELEGLPCDISDIVKDLDETEEFKKKLMKLDQEHLNVTFCEWQKVKKLGCTAPVSTKVTVTKTIQEFLKKFIAEVDVSFHSLN
jgi:hypothetical protein